MKQYVERHEFEREIGELNSRVERGFTDVGARIDKFAEKLEQREERKRPGVWVVLGVLAAFGVPLLTGAFAIVVTMSDLRGMQTWATNHEKFSSEKSDEFEAGLSSLRAIAAANAKSLEEQEMQHRWMADVTNLQDQRIEQLLRIKHPDIQASNYWPLGQIGKAQ